jgi:MFS family permease
MNKNLKYLFMLSAMTYFLQGIEALPSQSLFVYMKNILHLTPSAIMYIGSVTGIAWLLKIVWGFLIDNYLTKKIWYTLALGSSIALASVLGIYGFALSALIVFLTIASTASSFRDVAVDGIMCVEGKKCNSTGRIQSVQWIAITVASLIVGLIGGCIAQHLSYKVGYLLLLPLYLSAGILIYKFKEEKVERKKDSIRTILCKYKVLYRDKRFVFMCIFMFFYMFAPGFGTPLAFMQRDVFNWSEIWIGIFGAITSVCSIIGAILYYKFSRKINIKKWLLFSVFFGAITTLCYLIYTPQTAIIYGVLFAVIGMIIHLILLDTMARTTIAGLEATSFALLCGIHNLSNTISTLTGAYLLPIVGLQTLIVISACSSFLCLCFVRHIKLETLKNEDIS